jgi:hypothetical protein
VLRAFGDLNSFSVPLRSCEDGQAAMLALLSAATSQLMSQNQSVKDALKQLVLENKSRVSSFDHHIRQTQVAEDSTRAAHDARFASDSQIVADCLYLLVARYFGEDESDLLFATYSGGLGTSRFPGRPAAIDLRGHGASNQKRRYQPYVKFVVDNLRSACDTAARALFLYDYSPHSDGSAGSVFDSLSTLFVTFICFWRRSLMHLEREAAVLPREKLREINRTLDDLETGMGSLMGKDKVAALFDNMDAMTVENMEVLISEIVGIPIPCGAPHFPLMHAQTEVSFSFHGTMHHVPLAQTPANEEDAQAGMLPSVPVTSRGVHPTPPLPQRWDTRSSKRLEMTSGGGRGGAGHIASETEKLQHRHRVDQVALYLAALNEKLRSRKAILRGLLQLVREAKASVERREKAYAVAQGREDGYLIGMKAQEQFKSRGRDILSGMRMQEKLLLVDMQQKSGSQLEQVRTENVFLSLASNHIVSYLTFLWCINCSYRWQCMLEIWLE